MKEGLYNSGLRELAPGFRGQATQRKINRESSIEEQRGKIGMRAQIVQGTIGENGYWTQSSR